MPWKPAFLAFALRRWRAQANSNSVKLSVREESGLFGRRDAAEHRVAMREAAEPANRFQMMLSVFDVSGRRGMLHGELAKEPDRFVLVVEVLAVLEREIDKGPPYRWQREVESSRDRILRRRERPGIGRK